MGKGKGIRHAGAEKLRKGRAPPVAVVACTATQATCIPKEVSDWFDTGRITMMQRVEERSVSLQGPFMLALFVGLHLQHEVAKSLRLVDVGSADHRHITAHTSRAESLVD